MIGFGAGEPDFPTPDYIVDAAVEAARDPKNHRYTPAGGLPELKKAIVAKTARDSGLVVEPAQVLVTNGGKQAIYEAFAAMLDPGDEVIVPAPYWTTYPEAIQLAGGVPVEVLADETQDYKVTVEQLEAARTERTKVLLFVSPSNPTGAVYTADEIRAIGAWVEANELWVLTDEIYEHLVYDDLDTGSLPVLCPELADYTRGRERRREDLRHDRLAGGLGDRAEGHRQGGDQPAVARDLQRRQRLPARCAGRARGRPDRRRRDGGRLRPPPHDDRVDAQRDRRRLLPRPAAARSTSTPPSRGCSARSTPAGSSTRRPTSPSTSSTRPRSRSCPGEAFGSPGYLRLSYALGDDDIVEGITRLQKLFACSCATSWHCRRHTCTCTSRGRCGTRPCSSSPPATASRCPTSWSRSGRRRCPPRTRRAGSASSGSTTWRGRCCAPRTTYAAWCARPPRTTSGTAAGGWRSRSTRAGTAPGSAASRPSPTWCSTPCATRPRRPGSAWPW